MTRMGQKARFVAKHGAHLKQGDVELLATAFRELDKRLSPKALVAKARPKSSPIHHLFDWNVQRAAEKHWEQQAAYYIRSIEIVIERPAAKDSSEIRGRAWVPVTVAQPEGKSQREWRETADVAKNKSMMAEQVELAKAGARAWRDKWNFLRAVTELGPLFQVIDEFDQAMAAE